MDCEDTTQQPNNYNNREIVKISEISSIYPKQWVTVDITQREEYGWPEEGIVVLNSKNRSDITDRIQNIKGDDLYVFYTGSIDDGIDDEAT